MGDRLVSERGCGWGDGLIPREEGKALTLGQHRIYQYIENYVKLGHLGNGPWAMASDVCIVDTYVWVFNGLWPMYFAYPRPGWTGSHSRLTVLVNET